MTPEQNGRVTILKQMVEYGDYLEQLTYLIFLKMSDEYSKLPKKETGIPPPAAHRHLLR